MKNITLEEIKQNLKQPLNITSASWWYTLKEVSL